MLHVTRRCYRFRARHRDLELGARTRLMGVVNLTPDSFSNGGRYLEKSRALEHCLQLVELGADILDLGGESTRPGAEPLSAEAELERVIPLLEELRPRISSLISVDTYKARVAEEAMRVGADIINDISAFRLDPEMPVVAGRWQAGIILMHMRGTPQVMQQLPPSPDILSEIARDLEQTLAAAAEHGIARDRIVIDPGLGFGKTVEDNLRIINRLSFLERFDLPVLLGTSRKSFLGKILDLPVENRIWGTAASVAVSILRGAHIVRVHDVAEMIQVARVADAILAERVVE